MEKVEEKSGGVGRRRRSLEVETRHYGKMLKGRNEEKITERG